MNSLTEIFRAKLKSSEVTFDKDYLQERFPGEKIISSNIISFQEIKQVRKWFGIPIAFRRWKVSTSISNLVNIGKNNVNYVKPRPRYTASSITIGAIDKSGKGVGWMRPVFMNLFLTNKKRLIITPLKQVVSLLKVAKIVSFIVGLIFSLIIGIISLAIGSILAGIIAILIFLQTIFTAYYFLYKKRFIIHAPINVIKNIDSKNYIIGAKGKFNAGINSALSDNFHAKIYFGKEQFKAFLSLINK